ncbi:MAG: hypothetical protein JO340_16540 [Acidobacteriaceae bacterium]|nr:hypothetical protein [Acidobacteriaceae bacterium]
MTTLKTAVILGIFASTAALGSATSIYVTPDDGFETNIIAALEKKHVPLDIVTDQTQADYILTATGVHIHKESGAGKIARCMFAYCAGIEDSGDVSVQLVDTHTKTVVWAYSVAKQRAAKNRQSMAEAIAKHMKSEFVSSW